jgi:putative redox protein
MMVMADHAPLVSVCWTSGDSFVVDARAHFLTTDQPYASGGQDLGPTPTELFVASLGSCIGFFAERFMRRHDVDPAGLRVDCRFEMAEHPARIGLIDVRLALPPGFPPDRRNGLTAVVERCTVHNSIRQPPKVRIELEQPAPVT